MAEVIIDLSGRKGMAPKWFGQLQDMEQKKTQLYLGEPGQFAFGEFNPLRSYGYLSPANNGFITVTAATNAFDAIQGSSIVDHIDGDAYFFERGINIWKFQDFGEITPNEIHTITGATGTDLEIYEINGTRKLFYAYKTSSDGEIGIATLPFVSPDDDWLSAAASGGFSLSTDKNHTKMEIADNGFMYVMDGNRIHKIDGTPNGGADGTATEAILTFPKTFQCVDLFDNRGILWIAIMKTSIDVWSAPGRFSDVSFETFCGVYAWDRLSSIVRMRDFFTIRGIQRIIKIFEFQDTLHIMTVSQNQILELRQFTGSGFKLIEELGFVGSVSGGNADPRFHDSVIIENNFIKWLGKNGKFYYYGKIIPQEKNRLYILGDDINATAPGAIISVSNTVADGRIEGIYYGRSASTMGLFYPHGEGTIQSINQRQKDTEIFTLLYHLPKLSTVKGVTIFFPTLASGDSTTEVTLRLYTNNADSGAEDTATAITRADGVRGWKWIPVIVKNVNNVQLGLTYNNTNNISESTTITPSHAIIEYDPTNKLK